MNYCFDFMEDVEKEVDDLKYWFAGYLRHIAKEPDLAERLIGDRLFESDLFLLRGFCSKAPGISEKKYVFTAIEE
ncbi:MAG: hypothetical protein EOP04_04025 [Proteobacteria bacterium]|nr:MAG: hypothetical protein EOP04_04025 [Pseudomonadota bacterium]